MEINELNNITLEHFLINKNPRSVNLEPNSFNVLALNCHSVPTKIYETEYFLSEFNKGIEVVVITESWLHEDEEQFFKMANYNCFYNSRSTLLGSGTVVYVSNNLNDKLIFKCLKNEIEFTIIEIMDLNINIVAIAYNTHKTIENFVIKLNEVCPKFSNLIIAEDFNNDLLQKYIVSKFISYSKFPNLQLNFTRDGYKNMGQFKEHHRYYCI